MAHVDLILLVDGVKLDEHPASAASMDSSKRVLVLLTLHERHAQLVHFIRQDSHIDPKRDNEVARLHPLFVACVFASTSQCSSASLASTLSRSAWRASNVFFQIGMALRRALEQRLAISALHVLGGERLLVAPLVRRRLHL